jgi:hypothetical protein
MWVSRKDEVGTLQHGGNNLGRGIDYFLHTVQRDDTRILQQRPRTDGVRQAWTH